MILRNNELVMILQNDIVKVHCDPENNELIMILQNDIVKVHCDPKNNKFMWWAWKTTRDCIPREYSGNPNRGWVVDVGGGDTEPL